MPHKGCPHQCSFCNQKHITGVADDVTSEVVRDTIDLYLTTIDPKHRIEVAFYGGSFTAIDEDYQNELLQVAYEYVQSGKIQGIRLSTRPDAIDDGILQNLKKHSVTEIELGVQSMCDDVLKLNNRGHSARDVVDASKLIRQHGFSLGLQMMVGLIGDDREKSVYTAYEIAKLNPDFVRIYPTLVFNNTALGDFYKKGEYIPLSLDAAVNICRDISDIFDEFNIKIIRMGLYLSDEADIENCLAGPYHPRFRELVNTLPQRKNSSE